MYKKDIVNFLFVISFPVYGMGQYISAGTSPSVGSVISLLPLLAIILFHLIDLCYKSEFQVRLNGVYWIMMVYILSGILSFFVSYWKGLPLVSFNVAIGKSLLNIIPFHAFIVVYIYNRHSVTSPIPKLTFRSLSLLLLINFFAFYVLGMTNQGHVIEDRINLPFFAGLYEGASVLAITCLMMFWMLRWDWISPLNQVWRIGFMVVNFFVLYYINSRLTMMGFLLVFGLTIFNAIRNRFVYWISLFTLPILLSSGVLLYKFMSNPLVSSIMMRANYKDITTFNGRSFLWERAFDWLAYDRRGLILGNGYEGQYFTALLRDIEKLWHPEGPVPILHFHSASLEILYNQGLVGIIPFFVLFYKLFTHYRQKYVDKDVEGMLFLVVVFLLFDVQFNTYLYFQGTGGALFALLAARLCMKDQEPAPPESIPREEENVALV